MNTPTPNYVRDAMDVLAYTLPGLDESPELLRLYTLLVFTKGTATSLEDVHDAWALWRDITNPAHKSLIPFDQLTLEVQELDRKYRDGIRLVASALSGIPDRAV